MSALFREITLKVLPEKQSDEQFLKRIIAEKIHIKPQKIQSIKVLKRSIDARKKPVVYQLRILFALEGERFNPPTPAPKQYRQIDKKSKQVLIAGCGPAGLFAALKLLEFGIKPIILERGKDVRLRRRDLAKLNKEHIVNAESNYCFGEGGAGTYSDGKLYTRSGKRGNVKKILETFVQHGASEDILVDAHPHIGTNKLPQIITRMRETIISYGGEVRFNHKLTDLKVENKQLKAVSVNHDVEIKADQLILATGHSARDIFFLLNEKGIHIEFKPFALGVRIEHPQQLIDSIQYHCAVRSSYLPPASYSLVEQVDGIGVYSFCMCPGGIIAPCATAPGEIVTNGWSPSRRNNPFANSGIVVTIDDRFLKPYEKHDALRGLAFQSEIEQKACSMAGGTQAAPAQRLIDFMQNKPTKDLPVCSYKPGIVPLTIDQILPDAITHRLRKAFIAFSKKMKNYAHPEAVIVAPESRTSSPVRIPRDVESLQHPEVEGLFPCGEGAGYAGGIVSAAIDGEKCAEKIGSLLAKA